MVIESEDKLFLEDLNEHLLSRGIFGAVIALGSNHDGQSMFSLKILDVMQEQRAERLLLRDTEFLTDIGNMHHASKLFEIRTNNLTSFGKSLSSKPARWLAGAALLVLTVNLLAKLLG